MSTSNNTSIISKFITKEVENIYRKYSEIPQKEISTLASFIEKLEQNKIEFDPYLNYNTTRALAESLKNEDNMDMIRLNLFLRAKVNNDIEFGEAKDAYNRLECDGCVELHCYYFYYKHREEAMRKLAEDELNDKLYDADYVTAMFDQEELADMWIFGTTKEEAAKQYLMNSNWWNALESEEPEEGYTDSNGNKIYYCYAGREV